MAKQTARMCDFHATVTNQFRYYLASDFFRMGMLNVSSARVIRRSRASVSIRENANAFSNSLMRFFKAAFSSRKLSLLRLDMSFSSVGSFDKDNGFINRTFSATKAIKTGCLSDTCAHKHIDSCRYCNSHE